MTYTLAPAMTLCLALCSAPGIVAAATARQLTYEDFMKVPPGQRDQVFNSLAPESRADIMKRHLETWLNVHRRDLSSNQIAVVQEAIAFVTPDLYRSPPDAELRQQQSALADRLGCALGSHLASTVTDLERSPQRLERTWRQSARHWIDWVVNCVAR